MQTIQTSFGLYGKAVQTSQKKEKITSFGQCWQSTLLCCLHHCILLRLRLFRYHRQLAFRFAVLMRKLMEASEELDIAASQLNLFT